MAQPSPRSGVISRHILLSDIVSSSRLHEEYPREYDAALDRHNSLIEQTVADCGGEIFKNTGDGYYAFFDSAHECIACATKLATEFAKFPDFAEDDPFLVRITAHQGEMRPAGTEFFGPALNRASRLCQVCHPRQVILSEPAKPAQGGLPEGVTLTDLGEHHLRDLAKPEHLYQLNIPWLRQEFPPLPTLGNRPNNLVERPNAFVGRERELAELKSMLLDSRRLVTITAPGGYGKSRLAAHLCADLLERFERGVFFVELAPVRDHTGITTALANATGFQFYGSRDPEEQLIDFLREKEMLLCFDNFEHVLAGASFIGEILTDAPKVALVVTSREPLRITGEQVYSLEPLTVGGSAQAHLLHSDAVLLFADRALLVNAAFMPNEQNIASIHAICGRLDGIPLAIELAAAWMDSFTLTELLAELDQQLELTGRLRDIPGRHRSLRASLDWSWNLLNEEQQRMLMQLSTFRGGCFAEAASTVQGEKGMTLHQELAKLADKSWLYTREVDGQTRFFLRDAASHEYAFQKLEETRDGSTPVPGGERHLSTCTEAGATEAGATEQRHSLYESSVMAHARYFSELMGREGERLHGHGQLEALQRIRLEKQNIYEALDTLLNRLKQEDAVEELAGLLLPIARWLWEYLKVTSAYLELVESYKVLKDVASQAGNMEQILLWATLGCAQGQRMLGDNDAAQSNANRAGVLAKTLGNHAGIAASLDCLGSLEYGQGNYEAARELHAESLDIRREIGDRHGIALSLHGLGIAEYFQGNFNAAWELFAESLTIKREIGNCSGVAASLLSLGVLEYNQGNYDAARELYAESLTIYQEIGNRSGIAQVLNNLGLVEQSQGNYSTARKLYLEALAIEREIGRRAGIAISLVNLELMEYFQGNYDVARELCAESLAISRELGDRLRIAASLNCLGLVECRQDNYHAARELHAESLALLRQIGNSRGTAVSLNNLGLLEYRQGNYDAARELYAESLTIYQEIGNRSAICGIVAAISLLLAAVKQDLPGAIYLYGARYHAAEFGYTFEPMEREILEEGLATIEHPETGLPHDERERLKAQAEAMSLDELAEYALDALEKLEFA